MKRLIALLLVALTLLTVSGCGGIFFIRPEQQPFQSFQGVD